MWTKLLDLRVVALVLVALVALGLFGRYKWAVYRQAQLTAQVQQLKSDNKLLLEANKQNQLVLDKLSRDKVAGERAQAELRERLATSSSQLDQLRARVEQVTGDDPPVGPRTAEVLRGLAR